MRGKKADSFHNSGKDDCHAREYRTEGKKDGWGFSAAYLYTLRCLGWSILRVCYIPKDRPTFYGKKETKEQKSMRTLN